MRLAVAALLLPTIAQAGYVNNRTQWNGLSEAQQTGYVMGAIDEFTGSAFMTLELVFRHRSDVQACIIELELRPTDLVDIVNKEYEDLVNWDSSPYFILSLGLDKVCRNIINDARAERDQPLLP